MNNDPSDMIAAAERNRRTIETARFRAAKRRDRIWWMWPFAALPVVVLAFVVLARWGTGG